MKTLALFMLVLTGCVYTGERPVHLSAMSQCQRLVDPSWSRDGQASFMRKCLAVETTPGFVGLYADEVSASSAIPLYPGTSYGPYGQNGPTWSQFNRAYQLPVSPQSLTAPSPPPPQRQPWP